MKKRLLALFLVLLFIIPSAVTSFAVNPTSLEAPLNVVARIEDENVIRLRWTVPQSVVDLANDTDGATLFSVDWKVNNGPWQNSGTLNDASIAKDEYFHDYVSNITSDVDNVMEVFYVYYHLGLGKIEDFDLKNNTYTFRVRFAYSNYDTPDADYLVSKFSNETSVGKGANKVEPTKLDAPTNLKVETKKDLNGKPYFYLNWTNPATVDAADKNVPIEVKVDFKVGNGLWHTEKEGYDWWGGEEYATNVNFNPVEKEYVDRIAIEENTYYFRILYAYLPVGAQPVYSPFSNTVSIGINASSWAKEELQGAYDAKLVPNILKGADLTKPITREEFCELAVLLYEKTTGKTAVPASPNPFNDTNNPELLKAYALGITKGTKVGTSNIPFEPKTLINREQCATMLFRTIKQIAPDGDYSIAGIKDFPDQKYISSFAVEPTKYMSKLGIIKGDSKGYFMPKDTPFGKDAVNYGMATREAAILMSSRTYNQLK